MTTTTAVQATPNEWWLPLVEGILAIILGLMFLANPAVTSMGFVLGLGFYWFVVGVIDLVRLFRDRTYWGLKLFSGILGIVAGGLIIFGMMAQSHPLGATLVVGSAFAFLLAGMTIAYSVIGLIAAFRGEGWWPGVLGGFGILFGLLILLNQWTATLALPMSLGIVLIAGGIFLIIVAFRMR